MAKKFLKLVAALVAAGIAVTPFAFAGCDTAGNSNENENNGIITPNPEPEKPEPSDPEKPVEPEKPVDPEQPEDESKFETTVIPYDEIDAVAEIVNSGKNFKVVNNENNVSLTLERDVDKFYFTNSETGDNYFAINDGENDLKISYDSASDNWVSTILKSSDKNLLTVYNMNKKFRSLFNGLEFETYNTKTGEFKGTMMGTSNYLDCSVFINKENSVVKSFVINVKESVPSTITFSDFGGTSVEIPDYVKEDEVDKSETVLTVTNGQYNFNDKLIKPIVERWLKGENARNVDLVNETIATKNCETEQVMFMNLSKDMLELYIVYEEKDTNERRMGQFKIADVALLDAIKTTKKMTENELIKYLNSEMSGLQNVSNAKNYNVDYITTDADFAENKTQFNALTNKIIERAKVVGAQGNHINNDGSPVDYSDYNIVCGFKTKPNLSSFSDAQMLGENYNFYVGYLVEKDGNYKLLDLRVASKTEHGYNNLYLNITDGAIDSKDWMVVSSSLTDMTAGNGALYDHVSTAKASWNFDAKDVIVEDKERSL